VYFYCGKIEKFGQLLNSGAGARIFLSAFLTGAVCCSGIILPVLAQYVNEV
jgi:hypothetical protein